MGNLYKDKKEYEIALEYYIRALVNQPNHEIAKENFFFIVQTYGQDAISSLIQMLSTADKENRTTIAFLLRQVGEPALFPLIQLMKESKNTSLLFDIHLILGDIGDPRAIDPLLPFLNDDSRIVQLSAAGALSQIGDQRGIEYLIQMLRSNNPIELRKEAAKFLGNLANPKVIETLVEIVNIEEDDSVYNELIETFKKMGSIAVDPLIKILTTTSDKKIRTIVAFLLEKIGKPAVDPLIQILKIGEGLPPSHPEYQAIQSLHGLVALPLINIGEPAIDPLIQLLNYTMFTFFGGKIIGILKGIMEKPHLTEHNRLKISNAIDNHYERIGIK